MSHILREMTPADSLFVASHNSDTVELAMELTEEMDLKDKDCLRFG